MSGPKFDPAERARLAALEELAVENPELVAVLVVSGERRVVRLAAALKEIAHGAPTIMPTGLVEREHWRLAKVARAALREAGQDDA